MSQVKPSRTASREKNARPGKMIEFIKQNYLFFWIFLIAVICFNCFYHLGQFPARDWDEARHGVSAYEMIQNGNFWVNTYAYQVDYWNLKPPLSFWLIALNYKIFGYNLFALRFCSAISFVLTAFITSLFAQKRYGKLESLLVALFIACCSPFYRFHFARHGDADALFMLFTVLSILSAVLVKEHPRCLYLCGLFFSFAFLTKSWSSFIIVAVAGICFIWSKLVLSFKPKQWVLFFLSAFGPILIWCAVRYHYDGLKFLQGMVNTDLLNRTSQPLEGHSGGFFYYIELLFTESPLSGALPACILLYYGFLKLTGMKDSSQQTESPFKKDTRFYLIWILVPLILFSAAQTKTTWYAIPLFFPLVVFCALLTAQILQTDKKLKPIRWAFCIVLIAIVIPSFVNTYRQIKPEYDDTFQPYIVQQLSAKENLKGKTAYVAVDNPLDPNQWDQSYLLTGELYMNLKCQSGGIQGFLKSSGKSILLISSNQYSQNSTSLQKYLVVDKGKDYLCLQK